MEKQPHWHYRSISSLVDEFHVNPEKGLGREEALERLRLYGKNQLPEEKRQTHFEIFLHQLKSPLIFILLIAAGISVILGDFIDATIILAAIIVNTAVGYFQEYRANNTFQELRKMVVYKTKVFRERKEHEILTEEVAPGDILLLFAGDRIPADARILESYDLETVESSLTGESGSTRKEVCELPQGTSLLERKNMVFLGTSVAKGRARAMVVATGVHTEFGSISKLLQTVKKDITPLQFQLMRFSKFLGIAVGLISFGILLFGVLSGHDPLDMFLTSVAIAVASIPEGLLVSVTIILAIGMQRVLQKQSLIRHLSATETLGSISIICSDKTGTLTEGEMQVVMAEGGGKEHLKEKKNSDGLTLFADESQREMMGKIGLLCTNAAIELQENDSSPFVLFGDPTEKALVVFGMSLGFSQTELLKNFPRIFEVPFDREKKYMATIHRNGKKSKSFQLFLKGAPEYVLPLSTSYLFNNASHPISEKVRHTLASQYTHMMKQGLRVLAMGFKNIEEEEASFSEEDISEVTFVGFLGIQDPLRKEAKKAISQARHAGIRPILVTGDHQLTAVNIAHQVGLKTEKENVLTGEELDRLSDEELAKQLKKIDVYARVEPHQKLRIIELWQKLGHVVSMTGDGVNDAPALKKADVGIALGTGTDVAKEAADMVLLDNNFQTIVSAIYQGRIIFENIRKVIVYLLSDSFAEIILISGSIFLGLPLALLPSQILWINLIADGFPNVALTVEPGEENLMDELPRKKSEPVIHSKMKILISLIGITTSVLLLVVYSVLLKKHGEGEISYIRTIIFASLTLGSILYAFSCRSLKKPLWQIHPFTNKYLLLAVGMSIVLELFAIYLPIFQNIFHTVSLSYSDWALVIALGVGNIIAIEIGKFFFLIRRQKI